MGKILRRALVALRGRVGAPVKQPAPVRNQDAEVALLKAELAKTQQVLAATTELLTRVTASIESLTQAVMVVGEDTPGAAKQERVQGPLAEVLHFSAHRQASKGERPANASRIEGN